MADWIDEIYHPAPKGPTTDTPPDWRVEEAKGMATLEDYTATPADWDLNKRYRNWVRWNHV